MAPPAIGLCLIGAMVAVHIDEIDEISSEHALELARAVTAALEESGRRTAELDDPVWTSCATNSECVEQVRTRLRATEVVLLKLFGGLKRIRVVALRYSLGRDPQLAEIDVPVDEVLWPSALLELAGRLFPPSERDPEPTARPLVETGPDRPPLEKLPVPWIVLGASCATLATGIVFGATSASARRSAESVTVSDRDFESYADRAQRNALIADILYAVSAIGAIAAAVIYFSED